VTFQTKANRVFVAHGHDADVFNAENRCCSLVGRNITRCVGLAENLIDPDIDRTLSKLQNTFCGNERHVYEHHARLLGRSRGYDCVVYGHTHDGYMKEMDDMVYCNSGNIAGKNEFEEIVLDMHHTYMNIYHRKLSDVLEVTYIEMVPCVSTKKGKMKHVVL